MKSVMSLEMYKKLKLNNLDSTSIPHVVGASGKSLGARGKTKCEININSTEAATKLQNIQFSMNEPLVTFNHRYKAIHKVAFKMSPNKQESKTVIVEYVKKLPANTRTSY